MLKIRLQRLGRKNRPNYRIVVAEHSAAPQGKYVDLLGSYDPLAKTDAIKVDADRVLEWIKKGAQPSNTVARLLKGEGVKGMEPFIVEMKDKKKKNEEEPKEEAPKEEAAPAEGADTPAEEAPAEEVKEEASAEEAKEEPVAEEPKTEEAPKEEVKEEEAPAEEPAEEEKKEEGSEESA